MDFGKCTYISWDKYNESPEIMVQCGDILLVKTGSSYGKCAFVKELPKEATINPQFVVLKYIQIDAKYLTCVLQSSYARHCYDDFVLGTAIPTFTQAVLGNMYIPLPSITEQKSIVDSIKDWSVLVEQLEFGKFKLQDTIKQAKSKILDLAIHGKLVPQDPYDEPAAELLKRINPKAEITCDNLQYGKLPNGWCLVSVGDYVDLVTDFVASGSFASLRENVKYFNSPEYAILVRTKDFQNNFQKELVYTDKHGYEFLEKSNLYGGELVFSNVGSIGKVFIVPHLKHKMTLAPNAIMVRFHHNEHQKWFYYLFQSSTGLDLLHSITSATAIGKFNKTDFKKLVIPIPPLSEQHRIVARIEELFAQLDKIEASL